MKYVVNKNTNSDSNTNVNLITIENKNIPFRNSKMF